MKAYKFKSDLEKTRFYCHFTEKRNDIDMFNLSTCKGVRVTLNGDLHLIKNLDYKGIELISSLDELIFMNN